MTSGPQPPVAPVEFGDNEPLRRRFGGALWRLADLVQAEEARRSFRSRAFRSAVWALDDLAPDLDGSDEELAMVAGIGPGIIRLITEFRTTGTLGELERLAPLYPREVARLRRLPRLTPRRMRALKQELGIDTPADLLAAVETGAVEVIEGIGPATADRWERILTLPPGPDFIPAHDAAVRAGLLASHFRRHRPGDTVRVAGSVRRLDEWAARIDLVIVTEDAEGAARFLEDTAVANSAAADPGWAAELVLHDGTAVTVHLSGPDSAGSVTVRATGPASHLETLGSATTDWHRSEEDVYAAVDRPWLPPPARVRPLPVGDVVTVEDLHGDLHLHTDWSPDGHMPIDSILQAAAERGYQYIAFTDHTAGLRFGGLDAAGLRDQRGAVDELRRRHPELMMLHGAEINIGPDGRPDVDDDTLQWLDFVVAGCHSHFDLAPPAQTARMVAALEHPAVRVLAHPTGRRIGIRPEFQFDIDAVIAAAIEFDTALEVNGHRDRMDLSAELAERAVLAGARLAADGDAHRFDELDNISNSVGVMQRAGVCPESVVNALQVDDFLAWANYRR